MPRIAVDNKVVNYDYARGARQSIDIDAEKSNTDELPHVTRAIWVGGGGDLMVRYADDPPGTQRLLANIPSGYHFVVEVRQVYATGTTATQVVGEHS